MPKLVYYTLFVSFFTLISGCVTHKKRDDVGKVKKLYHDVTSKYNRNFNANLILDETEYNQMMEHRSDYSEILPVYPMLQADASSLAEPMDRAIEKASVAIAIHRPSHWTDDNYLIIGKAQFIKGDYESAEATFRYLVKHYNPANIISASAPKSRNVNARATNKERIQQSKEKEKERELKAKERKKEIKQARKDREKRIKAIRKERKLAQKNRAAGAKSIPEPTPTTKDEKKLTQAKKKKEKQKPFDEDPALPKVKGDPDSYFLKHKPAHQDAQIWLARTLIQRDRYGEADNMLRALASDTKVFSDIKAQIPVVQAHGALKRGQNKVAIEPLREAINVTRNKNTRARYAFILAQVLEREGQYQQALAAYEQVIKLRPPYEMNFTAQLNQVKMQARAGVLNGDRYARTIERMIKDDKNTEFQDQLYYALALHELKQGNRAGAIENFNESIRASAGNGAQKAESYYALAELFYQDEEYIEAKYYFDSTMMTMSKDDERFEKIALHAKSLSEIAKHLEVVELQDSLIRLSNMSEDELKDLAGQIKKENAAREQAALADKAASGTSDFARLNNLARTSLVSANNENTFFAYDDRKMKRGKREFSRTWGDIALHDNWRRSSTSNVGSDVGDEGSDEDVITFGVSDTEVEEIFKDVPKTEAEFDAVHALIEEALFNLGRLFRSELSNNGKSIEVLERMISDYPQTENALDAYYLLYVIYSEIPNTAKAEHYAQLIQNDYADSEYAKYIDDPSYLQNATSDEEKVEQYYQEVHSMYDGGDYERALKQIVKARNTLPNKHLLQSKFSLLTAMCIGHIQGREPYINALKETIAKYPNTEEEKRAKEIIRLLGIRFTDTQEGIEVINEDDYFTVSERDKLHMVLISISKSAEVKYRNEARIGLSDFNKKFYSLANIKTSMIILGENNDEPLLVIRRFDDRNKAMEYYERLQANAEEYLGDKSKYEIFAATQTNYRKVVQLKSVDLYRQFFVREYLSN